MYNITLRMRTLGEVRNFAGQKFRLTPSPQLCLWPDLTIRAGFIWCEDLGWSTY